MAVMRLSSVHRVRIAFGFRSIVRVGFRFGLPSLVARGCSASGLRAASWFRVWPCASPTRAGGSSSGWLSGCVVSGVASSSRFSRFRARANAPCGIEQPVRALFPLNRTSPALVRTLPSEIRIIEMNTIQSPSSVNAFADTPPRRFIHEQPGLADGPRQPTLRSRFTSLHYGYHPSETWPQSKMMPWPASEPHGPAGSHPSTPIPPALVRT